MSLPRQVRFYKSFCSGGPGGRGGGSLYSAFEVVGGLQAHPERGPGPPAGFHMGGEFRRDVRAAVEDATQFVRRDAESGGRRIGVGALQPPLAHDRAGMFQIVHLFLRRSYRRLRFSTQSTRSMSRGPSSAKRKTILRFALMRSDHHRPKTRW